MPDTLIILTPGFPQDERDSTCIPDRQTFVKVLKQTYPELNVVVLAFQYPYKPAVYRWNGIDVIALGGKNKSGLSRRLIWLRALRRLKKLNKEYNITGIISFWLDECAFIGDKFTRKHQLKHYIWLLGQDARPGNNYVKQIIPDGNNLIALSDFVAHEFNRNYGVRPVHIIPGAIDPAMFSHTETGKDIDIIGAGALIPLKQYGIFLYMISVLRKEFPQIKSVICGKGSEMDTLQAKINQLELQKNITLMGELPHQQVLNLMQRAKIFLHPSSYEGFGIVCLEALYAGAKVISFVRPMDTPIANWHVAGNIYQMQQIAYSILNDNNIDYQPVLPYTVRDQAKSVMQLFA